MTMTRNDVLNDERIKRYSEGNPTPTDLAGLQSLAGTEPLYAEALTLFAPLTEGEQSRILEAARLQVQLAELKDAVRALLVSLPKCDTCDSPAASGGRHAGVSAYSPAFLHYCATCNPNDHTTVLLAMFPYAEPVRRLQALLEAE